MAQQLYMSQELDLDSSQVRKTDDEAIEIPVPQLKELTSGKERLCEHASLLQQTHTILGRIQGGKYYSMMHLLYILQQEIRTKLILSNYKTENNRTFLCSIMSKYSLVLSWEQPSLCCVKSTLC